MQCLVSLHLLLIGISGLFVNVIASDNGDVRLRDGNAYSGRVEIFYDGAWGSICDDSWGMNDANVVCRQLGLGTAVSAPGNAFFGQSQGPILLDEVQCYGYEERLDECNSLGWYNHNCEHTEDAGVECSNSFYPTTPYYWTDGSIRLLGGSSPNEGRVEVYFNGNWNTVCDDSWDINDANVVCRQVGYSSATDAVGSAFFGPGSGDILLDDVNCIGYESSLLECQNSGLYQHDCRHSEDAGVICNIVPTPSYGSVRLAGSSSNYEGRVEIYNEYEWGTICDDYWDYNDALVVCRQLGFSGVSTFYSSAYFGEGSGPILRRLDCDGDESSWTNCYYDDWYTSGCSHSEDAGVRCIDPVPTPSYGSVRLAGSSSNYEGRVEIYNEYEWGTICDDYWDYNDALVVCRQLGFSGVSTFYSSAYFGEGSGPILRRLDCDGDESSWTNCYYDDWYTSGCSHSEDAGVRCIDPVPTPSYGSVRLAGSSSNYEGRVEIYNEYEWGTICDDYWDYNDALVVCRQLGFSGVSTFYSSAYFGEGSGPILRRLDCNGYESSWTNCYYDDWYTSGCSHSEDAGVRCIDPASEGYFKEGSTRLSGSTAVNTGRVEIYHDGIWGTVCDDGWGMSEADVVCRQLGYPEGAYFADTSAYYGEGDGPILLDDVSCSGWEHYLTECRHDGWYDHNCAHGEDAGVRCNIPDLYYPRLVNGTMWYEGRVEVWNNNRWEAVCSNSFYEDEARTVCKQLGFNDVEVVYYYEKFGNNFDVVSSVYFDCSYYDTALWQCGRYEYSSSYCEAAAIRCKRDESLSGGAIVAIVLGALMFASIVLVSCVTVHRQASSKYRRPHPNVAVISGTENAAGPRPLPTTPQGTSPRPQPSVNEQAPPSYNDVVNPTYYAPVNFSASVQPYAEGTAMPPHLIVRPGYPTQPNSALPHVKPTSVVHPPPPPQINQNSNQLYPTPGQQNPLPRDTTSTVLCYVE